MSPKSPSLNSSPASKIQDLEKEIERIKSEIQELKESLAIADEEAETHKDVNEIEGFLKKFGSVAAIIRYTGLGRGQILSTLKSKHHTESIPAIKKALRISKPLTSSQVLKINVIKKIYDQCGSLQKTAEKFGHTREWVRQFLEKGQRYRLFKYESSHDLRSKRIDGFIKGINRTSLIKDITSVKNIRELCNKYKIQINDMNEVLQFFRIDVKDYRRIARRGKFVQRYMRITEHLGHHPSTTEMAKKSEWRVIWNGIIRHWGGIRNFRKEFDIENPKRPKPFVNLSPTAFAKIKKMREQKALIKRGKKEKVLELIKNNSGIKSQLIVETLELKHPTVLGYLKELVRDNQIAKKGVGNKVVYVPSG